MNQTFDRQVGLVDIQSMQDNTISIIGCGAIGSYVASSLAKMGLTKFRLCDFDKVEAHNLPNQFFWESDIGKYKAEITADNILNFNSEAEVSAYIGKIQKYKSLLKSHIVISCVDDMDTRKYIFECCKKYKNVQLFIDTRMAGLQGQVYSIDMSKKKDIKNYEKTLFSNKEAVQVRCTEKSIIFTVLGIASIVCSQIVKALKGETVKNFLVLDYITPQLF